MSCIFFVCVFYCNFLLYYASLQSCMYLNILSWWPMFCTNWLLSHMLLLARLMGQYCFARCRRCLYRCRRAGMLAVGRPTLHGGPVWLRPVRATPCWFGFVAVVAATLNSTVRISAMAKVISGHCAPISGMAMAIAAIPVAPRLPCCAGIWTFIEPVY